MTLFEVQPGTVYFVGAGPGAPDLLTIRGRNVIAQADTILFADSLVQPELAEQFCRNDAVIIKTSGLHLDEIMRTMVKNAQAGEVVVRLHSGDPSIYGAIHEQMWYLDDANINYEIVPGIPAALAAAAFAKAELTVPEVVQTIILTRRAGRTPMPAGEELTALATHGASLAIHLSVTRIKQVIEDLLEGGYTPETPVAVFYKLSWPDESYVTGSISDIVPKVREAGFTRHALILVSPALDTQRAATRSNLYDSRYSHRFRRASEPQTMKRKPAPTTKMNKPIVISITRRGSELARSIATSLEADVLLPEKFASVRQEQRYTGSVISEVRRAWGQYAALILIMPTGVAVRAIGALANDKAKDPAVVCLDEAGQSVIALLGGHQAGANALARQVATITEGKSIITTASDVQGLPALDLLGESQPWTIGDRRGLTRASAALVNGEAVGVFVADGLLAAKVYLDSIFRNFDNVQFISTQQELLSFSAGLIVTHHLVSSESYLAEQTVVYHPPVLVVGMGCKRDTNVPELNRALRTTLQSSNLHLSSVAEIATVDIKGNELGLLELANQLDVPLQCVEQETLKSLHARDFSPSAANEHFGLPGVAEPCASVVADGPILVPKQSYQSCTVSIALGDRS